MRSSRLSVCALMVVLAPLAAGCDGSTTPPGHEEVTGRWEWVRATGGIAGVEITPESEGYTLQLRFWADGTVEVRRDGAVRTRTRYRIRAAAAEPGAPPYERIFYGAPVLGREWQLLVRAGSGSLVLADPCCDGFRWEFRPAR